VCTIIVSFVLHSFIYYSLHFKPYIFFFIDTHHSNIYTLSLHDALPICFGPTRCQWRHQLLCRRGCGSRCVGRRCDHDRTRCSRRSEEHTSELQSRRDLVCRLLLEKKKVKSRGDKVESRR